MEYPFKDLMPLDEVLAREGYYKDWTHLDPEVFYSLTQISNFIKTKGYGVDVRLLIAQLAEHFGLKTAQIVDLGNLLTAKHATLKTQFEQAVSQVNADRNALETQFNQSVAQMQADKDAVIANATVDSEVILARGGKPTLQARLDDTTAQLAETAQQIEDIIQVNIRDFGAVPMVDNATFDNTASINNAIAAMKDGQTLLFPGVGSKWRIDGNVTFDKAIKIIGNNATIEYHGVGKALKFGKDNTHLPASDRNGVYLEVNSISLVNKSTDITTTIGVEFCNVIQSVVSNFTVRGFGINWLNVGRNNCGCSQNTFYNQRLYDGGINLKYKCELGGWVTENTWVKGQNTTNSADKIALDISETDNYKPNNNQFNYVNFENRNSNTAININNAHDNLFLHCRFEGFKTGAIKLGVSSYGNSFVYGVGNSGRYNAWYSDLGQNVVLSSQGQSNFFATSGNGSVLTGRNLATTSNRGFPVFATYNKDNLNAYAFGLGHNALVGYRPDRQDNPFYYLDALTGKMYLTSGWFPKEEQPYMHSTSQSLIQVQNDGFTDIGFKIGNNAKPAFLILGDYYLWVDSLGKLRMHTQKPTNLDTNGTVIGTQS